MPSPSPATRPTSSARRGRRPDRRRRASTWSTRPSRPGSSVHDGDAVRFAHALFRAAVYELLTLSDRARLARRHRPGPARPPGGGRSRRRRRPRPPLRPVGAARQRRPAPPRSPSRPPATPWRCSRSTSPPTGSSRPSPCSPWTRRSATAPASSLDLADALVAVGDGSSGPRRPSPTRRRGGRRRRRVARTGRPRVQRRRRRHRGASIGDRAVCELLSEAAAALADDDVLGPLVEARRSVALSFLAPLEERTAIAAAALERARRGGDPADARPGAGGVVRRDRRARARRGPTRRRHRDRRARRTRSGDRRVESLGRRLLVEALLEAGDLGAAALEVNRFEQAVARLGRSEYAWWPALWRASLALARGDADEHRRLARRARRRRRRRRRHQRPAARARCTASSAAFDLGDPALGRDAIDAVLDMDVPDPRRAAPHHPRPAARGRRSTGDGSAAAARGAGRRGVAAEVDSEWLPMVLQLAELAVANGAVDDGATGCARSSSRSPTCGRSRASAPASVDRCTGSSAGSPPLDGDLDAARAHFDAARDAAGPRRRRPHRRLRRSRPGADLSEPTARADAVLQRFRAGPAPPGRQPLRARRRVVVGHLRRHHLHAPRQQGPARPRHPARRARAGRSPPSTSPPPGPPSTRPAPATSSTPRPARRTRARLRELEGELDEADAAGDAERSARLAAERDALVEQLTGAYGLGGRARTPGRFRRAGPHRRPGPHPRRPRPHRGRQPGARPPPAAIGPHRHVLRLRP